MIISWYTDYYLFMILSFLFPSFISSCIHTFLHSFIQVSLYLSFPSCFLIFPLFPFLFLFFVCSVPFIIIFSTHFLPFFMCLRKFSIVFLNLSMVFPCKNFLILSPFKTVPISMLNNLCVSQLRQTIYGSIKQKSSSALREGAYLIVTRSCRK